jgi:hypothetical protein
MTALALVVAFLAGVVYVATSIISLVVAARKKPVPPGLAWTTIGCALFALVLHVATGRVWQAMGDGAVTAVGLAILVASARLRALRARLQELRDQHGGT